MTDGTGASSTIVNATFAKSIYAYKSAAGAPSIPPPLGYLVAPGDSLTYRLTWTLPLASYEIAKIDDYLPSPVFDAAQVTAVDAASARNSGSRPAGREVDGLAGRHIHQGQCRRHDRPASSGPATSGLGGENRVSWDYGTYVGQQAGRVVDLLFTVTATTRPFGDALNLLNFAQLAYQNTVAVVTAEAAGVVTTTKAPSLTLQKTITGSSNGCASRPRRRPISTARGRAATPRRHHRLPAGHRQRGALAGLQCAHRRRRRAARGRVRRIVCVVAELSRRATARHP